MKAAGRATIFELGDMIGPQGVSAGIDVRDKDDVRRTYWARAVPEHFHDGLLARLRAAWEVACGRAVPLYWPKAGDLEKALYPDRIVSPQPPVSKRPSVDVRQFVEGMNPPNANRAST
jgi:hypothetical protein